MKKETKMTMRILFACLFLIAGAATGAYSGQVDTCQKRWGKFLLDKSLHVGFAPLRGECYVQEGGVEYLGN